MSSSTCRVCGFDPSEWNEQDAAKTLGLAPEFVQEWSGGTIEPLTSPLSRGAASALLDGTRDDQEHALHELWHGLVVDIAPMASTPTLEGTISQLNASSGGVPKAAIDTAEVGVRGIVGDVQRARVHHGRPWQALCLWSADVIAVLRAEGHPIEAGFAGENVTISGIDWAQLRGGMRFSMGEVECELSLPAVPCSKNNAWFLGADIDRMDHDLNPGFSRWYASVLVPGTINPGDGVSFS